jgi:hypothetical protein
MRGPQASILARRMRSSRLLLAGVLLTAFIASSLVAALATFDVQVLPQAAHRQLARSPGMSMVIIGLLDASLAQADTRAIRASMQTALQGARYQLDEAIWSDPLAVTMPGGRPGPQAEVAAPGQIEANAALAAGTWPGPPRPGQPVPAALPEAVAAELHVVPGNLLALRDLNTGARLRLRVSGLYRQRYPQSPYWGLDAIWTCSASIQHCPTSHGPIVVSSAAFAARAGFAVDQASWAVLPDTASLGTGDLASLAARIEQAEGFLQGSPGLGGLVASSGIPAALQATSSDLTVARSLLAIDTLLLLLPAAGALVLAARLLARHRDEESALLGARGAARWQLAGPALAEAILVGAAAVAAGAFAGTRLAGLLAGTGLLRGARLRLSGMPPEVWWSVLAVLVLCLVIMLWPALRPPTPGVARVRRGRQAALARAAGAGGDIALLALAAIAVWELRDYSAVAPSASGGTGIDPVLVLAPALALAGISLIPLRGLPVAARVLNRVTAGSRRLGTALASWEISRHPVRQAGPVLLAVLAVATGTLALAQYQSWHQSAQDQAAFATGSDVRVDTPTPVPLGQVGAIARAPGVTAVMALTSVTPGSGGVLLALDGRTAPASVLLRPDLSPVPAAALWRQITAPQPKAGVALPGRPARLEITASLAPGAPGAPGAPKVRGAPGALVGPGTSGSARGLAAASAAVLIQDASGAVYPVPAGILPADGTEHDLVALLSATGQAGYPLRLLGLSLTYTMPLATPRSAATGPARLVISGFAVASAPDGAFAAPFADGSALAAWRPAASSPGLPSPAPRGGPAVTGSQPSVVGWQTAAAGSRQLSFLAGLAPDAAPITAGVLTVTAPLSARIIAGIATRAFLSAGHLRVGSTISVAVGSSSVLVKIVAELAAFPTVTGPGGALIVDQTALQDDLISHSDPPVPVTSWWLRTATGAVPPGLSAVLPGLPPGSAVTDRVGQASALLGDSLSATPQQAGLAVAAAAGLLAVVGFSLSVAASLRGRRTQSAVLSALGVLRFAQAGQLCLEELMLSLPAAAVGLLAGAGLAYLIIPAVTLTSAATVPVPPVVVEVPLGWVALLAVVVAVIPVLAAAVTVARRPDPAARLRLAEAG